MRLLVFVGCNVENAAIEYHLRGTAAITKAVSEGYRNFKRIAIYGDGQTTYALWTCRQFMIELSDEIEVLSAKQEGAR